MRMLHFCFRNKHSEYQITKLVWYSGSSIMSVWQDGLVLRHHLNTRPINLMVGNGLGHLKTQEKIMLKLSMLYLI